MLKQKSGNVVNISASLAEHPIAGVKCVGFDDHQGCLNAVTRSLAMEYAKEGIRFNAVAPGTVDTALHKNNPQRLS
jgi:NAD(P)-dependent dehydrogenase (short-subunit alcohol dehydrogenase family)